MTIYHSESSKHTRTPIQCKARRSWAASTQHTPSPTRRRVSSRRDLEDNGFTGIHLPRSLRDDEENLFSSPVATKSREATSRALTLKSTNTPPSKSVTRTAFPTEPKLRSLHRSASFLALAPLILPPFTPQTPIEAERTLKRQADTMTRLSLSDDIENAALSEDDLQVLSKRKRDDYTAKRRGRVRLIKRKSGTMTGDVPSTPSPHLDFPSASPLSSLANLPDVRFGSSREVIPSSPSMIQSRHTRKDSESSSESGPASPAESWTPEKKVPPPTIPQGRTPGMQPAEGKIAISLCRDCPSSDPGHLNLSTPGIAGQASTSPFGYVSLPVGEDGVHSFIMKTLANGVVAAATAAKQRMPHTPVKRNSYLDHKFDRPWMSTNRTGIRAGTGTLEGGLFDKPRMSLPAYLPSKVRDLDSGSSSSPSSEFASPLAGREENVTAVPQLVPPVLSAESSLSSGGIEETPTRAKATYNSHVHRQSSVPDQNTMGKLEQEFSVLEEIGGGEFGRVLKVRYREGKDVFRKVYALKISKRFEGLKHRRRLLEEAELLKMVQRHSNVLLYVDSWEQDRSLLLLTGFYELGNFAHFLGEYGRQFGRLDEFRCWKVLAELSGGLKHIHSTGVIHLDLKPANIFLTADGRFVIGDFGMATIWPRSEEEPDFEREGDRLYLAPEILQGRYGKAADVFSLGMTMLETAANIVVPDGGPSWHKLRRDDFTEVDMGVTSDVLFQVIRGMMQFDVEKRVTIEHVDSHCMVLKGREWMERRRKELETTGGEPFLASALAGEDGSVLESWLAEFGSVAMW